MKKLLLTAVVFLASSSGMQAEENKVNNGGYPITQVPFTSVKVDQNSFWGQRIKAAREVTIPLAFSKCESEGRYSNFVKAANPSDEYDVSKFMGFSFDDTDVYKTIEGASYVGGVIGYANNTVIFESNITNSGAAKIRKVGDVDLGIRASDVKELIYFVENSRSKDAKRIIKNYKKLNGFI